MLPSYSFRGTVTDISRTNNTVTILVTHSWACEYTGGTATCTWKSISPRVLTGTVPVPEVLNKLKIGSSVEAGSIGSQGERWAGIGVLTPTYSSEPLHATDLYGDLGMLRAPLAAGYSLAVSTQPDCGSCSGTVCEARAANVTISRGGAGGMERDTPARRGDFVRRPGRWPRDLRCVCLRAGIGESMP